MLNDLMGELQLVGIDRSKRDAPAEVCLHMSLETTGMETLEGTVVASPQDAPFTSKCAYLFVYLCLASAVISFSLRRLVRVMLFLGFGKPGPDSAYWFNSSGPRGISYIFPKYGSKFCIGPNVCRIKYLQVIIGLLQSVLLQINIRSN